MTEDLERIKEVAVKAAQEGGKILAAYFGRIKQVVRKRHSGLVTEADKAAEERMISIIQETFPVHSILAEESGAQDHASAFKWVIDPLDGTTNYAHQLPFFCSSVGVEKNGNMVVAAVSVPLQNDLYSAIKGKGAYKNDVLLSVSQTRTLRDSLLATGFAYEKGKSLEKAIAILKPFMEITRGVRRCGSAVWDLCQVAEGHFDGFWEKNLQPWDVAAGILLVEEAGGKISKYNGAPTFIYDHEIVVSNKLIHTQMINILQRK